MDHKMQEMSREWRPTETQYRMVDALAAAGFINAMQRQCNHVAIGNLAQSINVVGMLLVTPEHVVRETVYWALAMQRHHRAATAVDAHTDCDGYSAVFEGRELDVPYLDVRATLDTDAKRLFVSIVNRHRTDETSAKLRLRDAVAATPATLHRLWHEDALAVNTIADPNAIAPQESPVALSGAEIELALPPHSYSIYELRLG